MIRGLAPIRLLALAVLVAAAPAAAAPAQLLNKGISISWVNSGTGKRPDGTVINFNVASTRTIYVSSAGRLFVRVTRTVMGRQNATSRTREAGPGDINASPARNVSFQGNNLVGTQAYASGAAQFVATFDPGFTSCSVRVVFGKSGGAGIRIKGPDDVLYDVQNISAGSPSCSVSAGNPFGGR